jgi:hypothetical protein
MSGFDRRSATLDEPDKRRSTGWRFGDLGDRFARAFSTSERSPSPREVDNGEQYPVDEQTAPWDNVLPRFLITKQGYDCMAVDEHVAGLERELNELDEELAELRARRPEKAEVAAEIERVGEQTSSILLAAHDSAKETTRLAQAQADRCIADAAAKALAMTADANRQLSNLESEKASLVRERERLMEDIRTVAAALTELAGGAPDRFRPGPVRAGSPGPAQPQVPQPTELPHAHRGHEHDEDHEQEYEYGEYTEQPNGG